MTGRPALVPKLCGGDTELGNFVTGLDAQSTGAIAARALLSEIDGVRASRVAVSDPVGYPSPAQTAVVGYGTTASLSTDARDWGRKFLPTNGGCAYIDLDHLEVCLPEVRSARDHVAGWHAMLGLAHQAMRAANRRLPDGQRIHVHANNSDGQSHSYGGHLNVLMSRRAWDRIFHEQLQHMLALASFFVSSMVYTGQGKVGSENARPPVGFQLSQRADFLETVSGPQTTFQRPIVNSRDEPLTGVGSGRSTLARLHVISLDTTLCHTACLLKVGALQIVLAMIEAEQPLALDLVLADPVGAAVRWSHDPTLTHRERTVTDRSVTAVEHQLMVLEGARRFVDRRACEGIVPGAARIVRLWEDTLLKLQAGNFEALRGRLDWVLKRSLIERALARRPDLNWAAPEAKALDHLYSSLDRSAGLYWAAEAAGRTTRIVSEEDIARFTRHPPEDTRAWTRAMLLRAVGDRVGHVDWDEIGISIPGAPWRAEQTISLPDPLGATRQVYEAATRGAATSEEIVDRLSDPAPDTTYH